MKRCVRVLRRRLRLAVLPAVILGFAGCGSAPHVTPVVAHPAATVLCPPGNSAMGCASRTTAPPAGSRSLTAVTGPKFPDVSSYQGHPNWAAAKSSIDGAVVKAFEYGEDPDFAWNVATLKALHIPWGAYDFVRSCNASGFIAVLRSVGGPYPGVPPILDEEVSAAAGCTAPLAAQIHQAFGVWPDEYTSPGTEQAGASAGSLGLWIADFGPSFPCLWTCHPVAWQFASPPYVDYYLPGIGTGDVNVDYHLFIGATPPPAPDPFLIYPSARISLYGQKVSERLTVERWWRNGCQNPVIRNVCRVTRTHLQWFYGRLYTLSHVGNVGVWGAAVNWKSDNRGKRYHRIGNILHGA